MHEHTRAGVFRKSCWRKKAKNLINIRILTTKEISSPKNATHFAQPPQHGLQNLKLGNSSKRAINFYLKLVQETNGDRQAAWIMYGESLKM